jgi:hypothetical protein
MLNYKLSDYKKLDATLFTHDISKHVMYYEIPQESGEFPKVTAHTVYVPYSGYQLTRWLELTMGILPTKGVLELGIRTEKDFELYAKSVNVDEYLTFGVTIGNLSNPQTREYSPKFRKILDVARNKKAVFYSSFEANGILLFKAFLAENGRACMYMSDTISRNAKNQILADFKNATGECFLLLHPSYIEGLSIFGADQIHLLEPIRQLAKKQQVIARVVRFRSHVHLPKDKQAVSVYQWACEVKGVLNNIRKSAKSLQLWAGFSVPVLFNQSYTAFAQDQTPDSIIIRNESKNLQSSHDITVQLRKLLPEQQKCCIKFPSSTQDNVCMLTLKSICDVRSP